MELPVSLESLFPSRMETSVGGNECKKTKKPVSEKRKAYERVKLRKRLLRNVGQAIADYSMIEKDDRIMVCMSGGKDSYSLLDLLLILRERSPVPFSVIAFNLDQKQPGFPEGVLPKYFSERGIPFHIEGQDTYSVVKRLIDEGKTMCSLCSRLRRGVIYRVAESISATKIALGHHRDDIIETFFLNLFYGGRLKTMPPKLLSDNKKHIVIRPLAYVAQEDIVRYADWQNFPIIPCQLCGNQDNLKRIEIRRMLEGWKKNVPGRVEHIFSALGKVTLSHLLDRNGYDFNALQSSIHYNDTRLTPADISD